MDRITLIKRGVINTMKKIISLLLCFSLVLICNSCTNKPASKKIAAKLQEPTLIPKEDLAYVSSGSEIQINKYKGSGGNVIIPSEIDGVKVTRIAESAFANCQSLTGIHLPNTLEYIGSKAFADSTTGNMRGVIVLPSRLKEIGGSAFADTGVTGIIIKCSCNFDSHTFWHLQHLKYVVISKEADVVLNDPFQWTNIFDSELQFIIIPDNGSIIIGKNPFEECPNITIYTPESSNAAQQARNYFIDVNSEDFETMYQKYFVDDN